jgi:hypothetical protein
MSETETGIIQPAAKLVNRPSGVSRWSMAIDSISIEEAAQKSKVLRVVVESKLVAEFVLNEYHARHLASLLSPTK